jgi:hypothetical protein
VSTNESNSQRAARKATIKAIGWRLSSIPARPARLTENTREFLLHLLSDHTGIEPARDRNRSPYRIRPARHPSQAAEVISAWAYKPTRSRPLRGGGYGPIGRDRDCLLRLAPEGEAPSLRLGACDVMEAFKKITASKTSHERPRRRKRCYCPLRQKTVVRKKQPSPGAPQEATRPDN